MAGEIADRVRTYGQLAAFSHGLGVGPSGVATGCEATLVFGTALKEIAGASARACDDAMSVESSTPNAAATKAMLA
jgi:hypothetical protein